MEFKWLNFAYANRSFLPWAFVIFLHGLSYQSSAEIPMNSLLSIIVIMLKKNFCDSFSSLASMSYRIVFCLNPLVIFSRQFNSRFSVVHHKLCINYSNPLFGRKSLCILNVNQPVVFFFQLDSHKITEKPIISLNRWKGCKAGPMPIIFIRLYWYSKIQSKRSFIWFIKFDCNVLMLRNEKLLE